MKNIFIAAMAALCLNACTPKVGSPEWCEMMDKKDKGDWTLNDAKEYARHCVLK